MIEALQQFDAELFLKINKGLGNDFFEGKAGFFMRYKIDKYNYTIFYRKVQLFKIISVYLLTIFQYTHPPYRVF